MPTLSKANRAVKEALENLKWVESAEHGETPESNWGSSEECWNLTTKKGILKTEVTRGVRVNEEKELNNDAKLERPLTIELPRYQIYLTDQMDDAQIRLIDKPVLPKGRAMVFPAGESDLIYEDRWDAVASVCSGSYSMEYDYTEDIVMKANVMAELLQFGKSHHKRHHPRGIWAYCLGLLPEQYVKFTKGALEDMEEDTEGDEAGDEDD